MCGCVIKTYENCINTQTLKKKIWGFVNDRFNLKVLAISETFEKIRFGIKPITPKALRSSSSGRAFTSD